jgi:hypothetical protein
VASSNTTVSVDAVSGPKLMAALAGQTFTFPNGIAAVPTTGSTTLTLTGTGAAPGFNLGSAQGNASGTTTFGSISFRALLSTITLWPTTRLQITFPNPSFTFPTLNMSPNLPKNLPITFSLDGTTIGTSPPVTILIAPDKSISINGFATGVSVTTLVTPTGTGSGS